MNQYVQRTSAGIIWVEWELKCFRGPYLIQAAHKCCRTSFYFLMVQAEKMGSKYAKQHIDRLLPQLTEADKREADIGDEFAALRVAELLN